MSTPKASKKLPGAWTSDEVATPVTGVRTSDEVAAPIADSLALSSSEPSEFEATGTSPSPFHLPPAELGISLVHPRSSLPLVTDYDLSVKWGLTDFEELANAV